MNDICLCYQVLSAAEIYRGKLVVITHQNVKYAQPSEHKLCVRLADKSWLKVLLADLL
jgi:hypothetical protein